MSLAARSIHPRGLFVCVALACLAAVVSHLEADSPNPGGPPMDLEEQARFWEAKLDAHLFDADGIVMSALDPETMQPEGVDRVYENSNMAMGSLLEAYCYRYAYAREPEVAEKAHRLFRVMHGLVGSGGLRGWVPRPHQNDTSVDQMIYVAHAFDAFHASDIASETERRLIRRDLADMAYYWRAHGYLETRPDGSVDERAGNYRQGTTDHALMAAFQLYDWHYNETPEARAAYEAIIAAAGNRLMESFLDEAARVKKPYVSHPYVAEMYAYLLDAVRQYDEARRDGLASAWRSWADGHANLFLVGAAKDVSGREPNGLSFETIRYDPRTNTTAPPPDGEITDSALGDAFHIAVVNALAFKHLREPRYLAIAEQILAAYDDRAMRWLYVDDPERVAPRFRRGCFHYNGYGVCTWLQAYWLARMVGGRLQRNRRPSSQ
ncbi:MAG: hypothetical protein JSV65_01845 [Armatimonadota bacterium]|nr:MAG: hypothetical protein JSV65_01845 [Armatimonadota bacterium]